MVNILIFLEIAGICTIFVAIALLLTGEGAREQKLMVYFLCGSLVQNAGYLLELTASTMEVAVAAVKVENLGSMFVPLCYCWFLYIYCYEKAPEKLLRFWFVLECLMLPIIFFSDAHTLFYKKIDWLETSYGYHYLSLEYGPLYYPFLFLRIILPYAMSIYILCRAILSHSDNAANRQFKMMLVLTNLPIAALLAYIGKLTQVFDLSPLALGLTLAWVVILLWSRRNYDFHHLAADEVLSSMVDGVITLDAKKRLISYNRAAAEIFSELEKYKLGDNIHALKDFPEDLLDESAPKKFERDTHYYESHAKQITNANGKKQGYVVVILDVTDTKNYIDEIKRVRQEAEQANQAKSEFLANMSHEIRTPMNAIIGLSDIIIEESRGRAISSYAGNIQSAAKNLLAIINDILDLSKVEAGKMELVMADYYIKALVNEVVAMMDLAASQKGILIKYEYDESIPREYCGDDVRIKQILINLMNNAVKFTKEGYVKISVGGHRGDSAEQEVLVFQVEDTGCGIKEEDQKVIFENFMQVDSRKNRSVEGTGLGLAIVQRLVQMMHGEIAVESVYGEGTKFTVTIPQKIVDKHTLAEMPGLPEIEVEEVETFVSDNVRVLIVDDNTINRKVAGGFLRQYGFELVEAESGFEAIELVKSTKFDIIFMDHMMPVMDGIETVQHIRQECGENGRNAVIVALTANAMEGIREKFLSKGFQDFLAKPLSRKPLNELLLKWIPRKKSDAAGTGQNKTVFGEKMDDSNEDDSEIENSEIDAVDIRGIDTESVKRYQAGSLKDYQDLLEIYYLEGKHKIELLQDLLKQEEYENYQTEVHGLKSASANIGAMHVSALAKKQEEAAARGDTAFIEENFPKLTKDYEQQLEDIRMYLEEQQAKFSEENLLPELDKEALREEIQKALQQLERFHSRECISQIEKLLSYNLDKAITAKLQEIHSQLKLYEDDVAELLLHQLLEWIDKEE